MKVGRPVSIFGRTLSRNLLTSSCEDTNSSISLNDSPCNPTNEERTRSASNWSTPQARIVSPTAHRQGNRTRASGIPFCPESAESPTSVPGLSNATTSVPQNSLFSPTTSFFPVAGKSQWTAQPVYCRAGLLWSCDSSDLCRKLAWWMSCHIGYIDREDCRPSWGEASLLQIIEVTKNSDWCAFSDVQTISVTMWF